jgi:hypothetical protein
VAESGTGSSIGFGNTRYPYYYGPEGRLVLVNVPEKDTLAINPQYNDSNRHINGANEKRGGE